MIKTMFLLFSLKVSGTSGAVGFSVDMAKSKNHTTHNRSRKWHRKSIKKPWSQRYEPLKGVDPNFPRNMHFAEKHNKKGLKKMQASNAKATSARAEAVKALVKPKKVKPRSQKSAAKSLIDLPASLTPTWKSAHTGIAKGPGLWTRLKSGPSCG